MLLNIMSYNGGLQLPQGAERAEVFWLMPTFGNRLLLAVINFACEFIYSFTQNENYFLFI